MADHTPGPWKWEPGDVGDPWLEGDGVMILGTVGGDVPTDADARLIAAAPDLLRALESLTQRVGFEDENKFRRAIVHGGVEHRPKSPCAVCEAIAKATGKAEEAQ